MSAFISKFLLKNESLLLTCQNDNVVSLLLSAWISQARVLTVIFKMRIFQTLMRKLYVRDEETLVIPISLYIEVEWIEVNSFQTVETFFRILKRVSIVWNEFSLDWLSVARLTRLLL